jgi:hypothetical protein
MVWLHSSSLAGSLSGYRLIPALLPLLLRCRGTGRLAESILSTAVAGAHVHNTHPRPADLAGFALLQQRGDRFNISMLDPRTRGRRGFKQFNDLEMVRPLALPA